MPKFTLLKDAIPIPLTVPEKSKDIFCQNYLKATHTTGRLFMFAGDQKVEHLNKDFYGPGIDKEDASPEHLFEVASQSRIGVFATNLGLIARHAGKYTSIPFMVKLNGKTDLIPKNQADPISNHWTTVQQVIDFKTRTHLNILGVGMTVYLGSEHEGVMLAQAAQAIYEAHSYGLITTVWMYPRGKAVVDETHPDIIAGAAGVAVCLGADFVKVNPPKASDGFMSAQLLEQATKASGTTGVICSGGMVRDERMFLQDLYHQIHIGGSMGAAIGRNIHQKSLVDAVKLCKAIASVVIDDADVECSLKFLD